MTLWPRRTEEPEEAAVDRTHPYAAYKPKPIWKVIQEGLKALPDNGDIIGQTERGHVVGYLTKALIDAGFDQVPQPNITRVRRIVSLANGMPATRAGAA
jgi:hypothetical protein